MMIIDPVTFGDVAFTRPAPKWVFDRTGTLVQVPAGSFAVTYDPMDLTKAPYALIEPAATNLITYSENLAAGWTGSASASLSGADFHGIPYYYVTKTNSGTSEFRQHYVGARSAGQKVVATLAMRAGSTDSATVGLYDWAVGGPGWGTLADATIEVSGAGSVFFQTGAAFYISGLSPSVDTFIKVTRTYPAGTPSAALLIYPGTVNSSTIGHSVQATRVQVEIGRATSYIRTAGAAVTRAADGIASGAGLVYSNVPITEPDYSSTSSYAKDVVVHDPATHNTYVSIIAGNVGKALTDTSAWAPNGVTNRWAMLDQYNNTQTSSAEEIIVVLTSQELAQGVYIGNADASDVRISCYDQNDGLVYQETQDLIIPDSGSSFYNWCFKPIRKKSYAVSVQLPPYYAGLVTIALRKPAGTAKCGMCVLGPLVDIGLSKYGLSREIKDYSTVNFNFDGTSNVQKRNFAKVMDVDVLIDNAYIDSVIEALENYRQKPVAWIGVAAYGSACLFGTYTSFKSVIQYPTQSAMNLQIQGTV
ncbi:hypothetical protein ACEN9H_23350 [Massilia cellulosiltytica]|uniref:phage head spike fiber domain-containing protein n=1 Tax=Massilia cellulosiltytica TaxID=2683234 RepID=UPI0039B6C67F